MPTPKNAGALSESDLKKKEAEIVSQHLRPDDYLVALDEKGQGFASEAVAKFLEQQAMDSIKNTVFLIGGAYGIDETILRKAKLKWSLSSLTFPHQLVRLILAEQIYRACTILRNEKYHHKWGEISDVISNIEYRLLTFCRTQLNLPLIFLKDFMRSTTNGQLSTMKNH